MRWVVTKMFEFAPISPAPVFMEERPIALIVDSCLFPIGAFVGAFGWSGL